MNIVDRIKNMGTLDKINFTVIGLVLLGFAIAYVVTRL